MIKYSCDYCGYESEYGEVGTRRIYALNMVAETSSDSGGFDGTHVCEKCLMTMHHEKLYKCYDKTEDKGEETQRPYKDYQDLRTGEYVREYKGE